VGFTAALEGQLDDVAGEQRTCAVWSRGAEKPGGVRRATRPVLGRGGVRELREQTRGRRRGGLSRATGPASPPQLGALRGER
jgi:hypothetical protein